MIELIILIALAVFALTYRFNNGENVYKFFVTSVATAYDKYAPYSFKEVRKKTKELGQEYTTRQYLTQIAVFAIVAFGITYLYFYNKLHTLYQKTMNLSNKKSPLGNSLGGWSVNSHM